MSYNIVALIGPSGSGKDTILQEVLHKFPHNYNKIINSTTRPRREGEVNGQNYYFVKDYEFATDSRGGSMIEESCFNHWHYGTNYETLDLNLINIGVFSPSGIRQVISHSDINLIIFQIETDDKNRLLRQLNRENQPDVNEIVRRFGTDKNDFNELEFNTIRIKNNTKDDLINSVNYIDRVSRVIFDRGQN